MRTKVIAGIGVVLVVLGIAAVAFQRLLPPHPGGSVESGDNVAAGELAANFDLKDLKGNSVTLRSMRGKVVFLNIWATWCGPCREEMPSMEALFNSFKNRKDFVMLAVSQDRTGRETVEPYIEHNNYHFEILLDPDNQLQDSYNLTGVPETFIIDRKGRIVAHHLGAFDWSRDEVREALQELLQAKPS